MDAKTKEDCLDAKDTSGGGCAWCSTPWQPEASCMSETTGKYMPFAKCKFPKPALSDAPSAEAALDAVATVAVLDASRVLDSKQHATVEYRNNDNNPIPGAGCMAAKSEKECFKTEDFMGKCAWCKSQWQGQTCVSESQAKLDPLADCKFAPS
jgi:hypothetical protein